jgi:hypothetical protein
LFHIRRNLEHCNTVAVFCTYIRTSLRFNLKYKRESERWKKRKRGNKGQQEGEGRGCSAFMFRLESTGGEAVGTRRKGEE